MYGYGYGYRQPQYGPLNALADILGAYWNKKATEGALDYASKAPGMIDDATAPKYVQNPVQPEQYGTNAAQQAAATLLPMGAFSQAVPTSNPAEQAFQSIPGNNGKTIMQAAQDYQKAYAASLGQPQGTQQDYDAFAAAKAANPEWYVGDTYVGNDAGARQQAQADQQKQAALNQQVQQAQYNKAFDSGMGQYGFTGQKTAPLSYTEYAAKTNGMKPQFMRDMVSKYGIDSAKMAEAMIDKAITDKNSAYADQIDAANRQKFLAPYLLSKNIGTQSGLLKALWGVVEYNHAAQAMGKPTIDSALLGKLLDAGKIALTSKDVGGTIQYYAVPKEGVAFDDGDLMKSIFTLPKTETPDTRAKLNEAWQQWNTQSANNAAQMKNARDIASMNNQARAQLAAVKRGNAGSQQLQVVKAIMQAHNAWVKNNYGEDETKDPNWANVQAAQKIISGMMGNSDDSSASSGAIRNATGDYATDMSSATDLVSRVVQHGGYTWDQIYNGIANKYGTDVADSIDPSDWGY